MMQKLKEYLNAKKEKVSADINYHEGYKQATQDIITYIASNKEARNENEKLDILRDKIIAHTREQLLEPYYVDVTASRIESFALNKVLKLIEQLKNEN